MAESHEVGRHGEELAALHLQDRGWRILCRNYRLGHKEIDLIARRGSQVIFVEVKTRRSLRYGHPLEAISPLQRREIVRVARSWIVRYGQRNDLYRFDAIAVLLTHGSPPQLDHLEDAWRL